MVKPHAHPNYKIQPLMYSRQTKSPYTNGNRQQTTRIMIRNITLVLLAMSFLLLGCQPLDKPPLVSSEHAVEGAYAATLSRDAGYSLVSSIHHGIALWDLKQDALKYQWSHQGSDNNLVLAAAISDNNSHALTADRENFALWSIETGENLGFWKVRESNIRDVALAKNASSMLIGKSNGVVVHITPTTGRRLEFLGHSEKINSVDLAPNGRFALTGGNDYSAYFWDTQSGQVVYRFSHPSRVTKVALHHNGRYAFTADSKKQARIWDLLTGEEVSQLIYTSRQQVFSAVRFSDDGERLLTGAPTRKLTLWDTQSGKALNRWLVTPRKHSRPKGAVVYSVAFAPEGDSVISESSSGLLERWALR